MLGSALVQYKWEEKESFFESPNSVPLTVAKWAWRGRRVTVASQP